MIKSKKLSILITALVILQSISFSGISFAAEENSVVINEVAWMGTPDSSSDEWLELYNTTNQEIDLSGWYIEDDVSTSYVIESGSIAPHGYFLIEDMEEDVSVQSNAVIGLSLANAGDSLNLFTPDAILIDSVNSSGGAWFAGNSTTKATMERVNPKESGNNSDNWLTNTSGNGSTGRDGNEILGTPLSANSVYAGNGSAIILDSSNTNISPGETFTVTVDAESVIDLYAYGIELQYDPDAITFVNATESNFLKSDGSSTSFNIAKENGVEGKLIIGNSRILNPPYGVDGSGELLNIEFKASESASGNTNLSVLSSSFLSDSVGDLPASFNDMSLEISTPINEEITNVSTHEGNSDYSVELSYEYSGDVDTFVIEKQLPNGSFEVIGNTSELTFSDSTNITTGINYTYKVTHVLDGQTTASAIIEGGDSRGISGDINHSYRVDGRDVELLARAYGSEFGDEEYNILADTNYDGIIDGNDLINIGANFGIKSN